MRKGISSALLDRLRLRAETENESIRVMTIKEGRKRASCMKEKLKAAAFIFEFGVAPPLL